MHDLKILETALHALAQKGDLAITRGAVLRNEIVCRQWRDGKVVSERYCAAA